MGEISDTAAAWRDQHILRQPGPADAIPDDITIDLSWLTWEALLRTAFHEPLPRCANDRGRNRPAYGPKTRPLASRLIACTLQ
jgi:hypothetical protein